MLAVGAACALVVGLAAVAVARPRREANGVAVFLRHELVMVRRAVAEMPAVRRDAVDYATGIAVRCGGLALHAASRVGARPGQQHIASASWSIAEVALGSIALVAERRFDRLVGAPAWLHRLHSLRWPNRTIETLVLARADEARRWAKVKAPRLCRDLAAWRASSGKTVPADAVAFLTTGHDIENGAMRQVKRVVRNANPSAPLMTLIMRRMTMLAMPTVRGRATRLIAAEASLRAEMESTVQQGLYALTHGGS